jgi:hypothetical protein
MVQKLSDKIQVMMLPSGQNFILDSDILRGAPREKNRAFESHGSLPSAFFDSTIFATLSPHNLINPALYVNDGETPILVGCASPKLDQCASCLISQR